jgi:hypothetical protein
MPMMSAFIKVCKMQEKIIKYGVLQLEGKGLKLLYPFRDFFSPLGFVSPLPKCCSNLPPIVQSKEGRMR